jgi:hypothetical protein
MPSDPDHLWNAGVTDDRVVGALEQPPQGWVAIRIGVAATISSASSSASSSRRKSSRASSPCGGRTGSGGGAELIELGKPRRELLP